MRIWLNLTLYAPQMTGPQIFIPANQITAVRQANPSTDPLRGMWRSIVHVTGGEHIAVCEEPEKIMEMLT